MADASRQSKLASAKKKLKEYQQKNSPGSAAGAKKKRKSKEGSRPDTPTNEASRPETPTNDGRESPENIQNILKVLVSDLNRSNGVAIPSLDKRKAYCDGDVSTHNADQLAAGVHMLSNSNSLPSSAVSSPESMQVSEIDHKNALEENRSLSFSDSLRQLSEQLNGLVNQPTAYVNGENASSADMKEMATRYQELLVALEASSLQNRRLSTKIEELKQQNQEIKDQLEQEKLGFEQRFSKEQAALREQLQVHIQTIGILVSEKAELQTALAHTQQAARHKAGEAEDLSSRVHSARRRISELEHTLSSLSVQQKQTDRLNKELAKDRDGLKMEVYKQSKNNEEFKQQNSELSEKLRTLISENSAMKLDVEDLHKKLEMAELMIQQFTNQPRTPDVTQQLQIVLEEKANLETQIAQLSESIQQLQTERDQYVHKLKEEGRIWQQRVQLLSDQVQSLAEEKELNTTRIQELEASLSEQISSQSVVKPLESDPSPHLGPTEAELCLQEELIQLQKEKEELREQCQAQMRDNEQLSRLNQEQEEQLQELEKTVQRYSEEAVDRQQILENMQSDKATISRAMTQNRELKEQLAELQNGFVKLTNENMEVTSALQSEQHVKKELAKKIGELQEKLAELQEMEAQKTQEARALQEQRDQYYVHLQQYTAAYQQLATEKEELHKQYLLQVQLMDRLQHEEVQGKVTVEMHFKELQEAKESLEVISKENKELQAQISQLMAELDAQEPGAQGDGMETEDTMEELKTPALAIPDNFESKEDMVAFLTSVMSQTEAERAEMRQQLSQQRRQCRGLLKKIAILRNEQQLHVPSGGDSAAHSVPGEVHEALKSAMEKLQSRFTDLMHEKAELKDRVEELEHRCIQLSGETDTIGEYIALYQSQRAILKQRHREKEEYISRLAQDKEEMKMKLLELQELVMRLVGEKNEWYIKYMEMAQNVDPQSAALSAEAALTAVRHVELNATSGEGLREVSLADEPELAPTAAQCFLPQTDSKVPQPASQDPTAKQIMHLLHEIQNPRDSLGSFLQNPCIPFFYRADENDEVKILVV